MSKLKRKWGIFGLSLLINDLHFKNVIIKKDD